MPHRFSPDRLADMNRRLYLRNRVLSAMLKKCANALADEVAAAGGTEEPGQSPVILEHAKLADRALTLLEKKT